MTRAIWLTDMRGSESRVSTANPPESLGEHELIQHLLDPAVYPWRPDHVEHRETHISRLFFAGDRVVKIKRPVMYGFADLRTLDRRRQSCLDDIRLNRLLSDDIYLGALPITRAGTGLRLGGDGAPVEWATVMRRLPESAMLDVLLERGARPERLAERLAARLIPFHQGAAACPGEPARQAVDAERIVRENLDEIAAFTTGAVFPLEFALIRRCVLGFLERAPDAILRRAEAGWIREGHGDLKCEHVVLDPPGSLQVYDAVEFSLAIRCADVASDLAFLLLDLERLGAGDVAQDLVRSYRAAGINLPDDMLTLYRIHRALVRVKVAALTIEHATAPPSLESHLAVAQWLHVAASSALRAAPMAIAMTGFSGSGKSVVARAIAQALGTPLLSTDAIRHEEAGAGDRYTPEQRLANYRRLMEQARQALATGSAVVLDGAFLRSEERALAAELARETGAPLVFVEVIADPDVVDRRIRARSRGEAAAFASEATAGVLAAQREAAVTTPPLRPHEATFITIDTSADTPASLDPLFEALSDDGLLRPALQGSGFLRR
jgi:aminoglycoside phosphotransferase family enzyme/predicted kinase